MLYEVITTGIADGFKPGKILTVKADDKEFQVKARVDTPLEIEYLKNGGVLHYVLRRITSYNVCYTKLLRIRSRPRYRSGS